MQLYQIVSIVNTKSSQWVWHNSADPWADPRALRSQLAAATTSTYLAGLRVHLMRLCARKARHLDVGEVIVFGVVSGPSLDVACVGAAVEERRHAERTEV
jgi:hypothetical protein